MIYLYGLIQPMGGRNRVKVINLGSDTVGNLMFSKGLLQLKLQKNHLDKNVLLNFYPPIKKNQNDLDKF